MTPDQMRVKAVALLADEFDRTHENPQLSAERFIGQLMRSGWRPVTAVVDTAAAARRAPASVAQAAVAEIRGVLADKAGHRPELAGGCNCRGCVGGAA